MGARHVRQAVPHATGAYCSRNAIGHASGLRLWLMARLITRRQKAQVMMDEL